MSTNYKLLAGLILVAFISRIAPHYPNFTAVGALAFYSAMNTRSLVSSLAMLVGTMMLSDVVINNLIYPTGTFVWMYSGSIFTYLGFAAYSFLGRVSKNGFKSAPYLVIGSILFFAFSNLGVFLSEFSLMPKTLGGLWATYAAAIPFYAPELLSTALFTALAVGAHSMAVRTQKA
jgi:hypothetical protein